MKPAFTVAIVLVLVAALHPGAAPAQSERTVVDVTNGEEFERALAGASEPVTIRLAPGEYRLTPEAAVDPTCGNCEDPAETVPITVGARISGPSVWIEGPPGVDAVIVTNAGYGLLVEDSPDCSIRNVTVTGGVRDTSQAATDAAIVVRRSKVRIQNCIIRDNIGDGALIEKNIVGIMGICGREGADIAVFESLITRNSWDGIALYRGARAYIFNNIIDGVDRAGAKEAGGGRGVGIGVTWDATARIEGNLVRRYWKGIGVFVDADAQISSNIVEEITAWGIAVWDAGKGTPSAAIVGNAIYDTGACGVSITRESELTEGEVLRFASNIVVRTGQNAKYDDPEYYCAQCALAVASAPGGFAVDRNLFHGNRRAGADLPDYDVPEDEFRRRARAMIQTIIMSPDSYAARQVFIESSFMAEYAR